MKHIKLTDDELKSVADFWSNWVRSGGEGEPPNAFQLEALNDFAFRDAFLFWQAGGVIPAIGRAAQPRAVVAYDLLGPLPTDFDKALKAQASAIATINVDIDVEDTDTGSVMVFAYAIWATLLGRYEDASKVLAGLTLANLKYASLKMKRDGDNSGVLHQEPLAALAYAAKILGSYAKTDPLGASDKAREAFGVLDGSPAHAYILAEAIAEKEKEYSAPE